jgi:hypothetical protein
MCCEWWRLFWRPIKLICLYLLFCFIFRYHSPNSLDTLRSVSIWNCTATLNIDLSTERRRTVSTEVLFLKKLSTANSRCSTFRCTMDTDTVLSELPAGSHPTPLTPLLSSTSHLKNMRFLWFPLKELPYIIHKLNEYVLYLLVLHAYVNEMHGSRSKIPRKRSGQAAFHRGI